jgi:hypothetical protein
MRVRLVLPDRQHLRELTELGPLNWGGRGPRLREDGRVAGEVYVSLGKVETLKKIKGIEVEVIEDATEVGKERQKEVGQGDRFEGGKKVPHGLGRKE